MGKIELKAQWSWLVYSPLSQQIFWISYDFIIPRYISLGGEHNQQGITHFSIVNAMRMTTNI